MSEQSDKQQIGAALCPLISAALPAAVKTKKWNAPNFSVDGYDLITLNFSPKNPVRIVFHLGAKAVDTKTGVRLVGDDSGRLTWATDQRAYASLADMAEVHASSRWLVGFCQKWIDAAKATRLQFP
jgi:Domain of unknown function (DU1801)